MTTERAVEEALADPSYVLPRAFSDSAAYIKLIRRCLCTWLEDSSDIGRVMSVRRGSFGQNHFLASAFWHASGSYNASNSRTRPVTTDLYNYLHLLYDLSHRSTSNAGCTTELLLFP